ncbi:MAG: CHAT domain-containing protein [Wenzhouxiangella sp.]|nr:CHAT domain-containing protein [Wenzhouxiangella sp.]
MRTLLIRADGPLLLLPFAAIMTSNDAYLVERFTLERVHTLGKGHHGMAKDEPETLRFAGFAYAGGDENASDARSPAGRLQHVNEEIEWASAQFGSTAERYFGVHATETRAKEVGGRRVLHFASHAVVNPVEPLNSYISLAADEQNDGRFELWELMADLSLDGGLVVLSGCQTALGPNFPGEGLFGLAKGFAYAGADAVIASLWAIDDASTMHLSQSFYRELSAGRSRAEALAQAQRALLSGEVPRSGRWRRWLGIDPVDHYRHPYYWASLTLTRMR